MKRKLAACYMHRDGWVSAVISRPAGKESLSFTGGLLVPDGKRPPSASRQSGEGTPVAQHSTVTTVTSRAAIYLYHLAVVHTPDLGKWWGTAAVSATRAITIPPKGPAARADRQIANYRTLAAVP